MRPPSRPVSSLFWVELWALCGRWIGLSLLGLVTALGVAAAPLTPSQVPEPLRTWVPWVMQDEPRWACPSAFDTQSLRFCAWPGVLQLDLQPTAGRFTHSWQLAQEEWVALPGDAAHWPQDVLLNGRPAAVLSRDGVPSVRLPAGAHRLEGQWRWSDKPESLGLPASAALLRLTWAGKPVAEPVRDDANRVWLGRQQASGEAAEEQAQVQLHRQWADGVPMRLHTRLRLEVSGKSRELTVARSLLPGWVAQELVSPLPAALGPNGSLRVQARAGVWELTLIARHPGQVDALDLPALPPAAAGGGGASPWLVDEEELWAFAAAPQLRTVSLDGAPAVDPQQTTLPPEWRQFPTYLMRPDAVLRLKEQRRGDADPASDKLALKRRAWLSFDGQSLTFHDRITGRVNQATRLELSAPAQLGRADVQGSDQLITLGSSGLTGLELRRGPLELSADSVVAQRPSRLSAVGWQQDFDSVALQLSLPAGWRLLHASGVDQAHGSWLAYWDLLDFFVVLIMTLTVGRLWGVRLGVVTFVMVVLLYQEPGFPLFMWLPLLVAAALGRVIPTSLAQARRVVGWVERASLGVLLLLCLQFTVDQVRMAMYPVLEQPHSTVMTEYAAGVASVDFLAQAPLAAAPAEVTGDRSLEMRSVRSKASAPAPSQQQQAYRNVDPNAQVQTGPGLPSWSWHDHRLQWDGPVLRDQSLRLWLLPPWAQKVVTVLRLVLLGVLLTALARQAWRRSPPAPPSATAQSKGPLPPPPASSPAMSTTVFTSLLASAGPVFLAALLWGATATPVQALLPSHSSAAANLVERTPASPGDARASASATSAWPTPALLSELKTRLTETSPCLPHCAELSRLTVVVTASSLRLGLEIDADRETAVPVPGGLKYWVPREVVANGRPEVLMQGADGRLWLWVGSGHQRIDLVGELPAGRDILQLPLPLKPHQVQVQAIGWDVEGLSEGQVGDTVLLSRQRAAAGVRRDAKSASASERPQGRSAPSPPPEGDENELAALPAYLRVERRLFLDLVWRVETTVRRESPRGVPALAQIPLLPGEAVTSSGINVRDGKVQVNLGPQSDAVSWSSTLAPVPRLSLTAAAPNDPAQTPWAESWWVDASTVWHVGLQGVPPAAGGGDAQTSLAFYPWPGETLTLQIDRPQAVAGQTLTVDRALWAVKPGARATDYELSLSLRSSRGLDHNVILPEGASLQEVVINGQPRALRAQGRVLTLPVLPGKQSVVLRWRVEQEMGLRYRTQPLALGLDSVNHQVRVSVPANRWLLWASGPGLGPAILFWGVLLVFLAVGCVLARVGAPRGVPLRRWQWLLLMLGLTQVSPWAGALVIGWFFLLAWRGDPARGTAWASAGAAWRFNLAQLGLVLSTMSMLAMLCYAVAGGLLGQPDMQVQGNGSSSNLLQWTQDRVREVLPPVTLITLPMLVYRGFMLAWALWLAWSLLAWLKWGWGAWSWGVVWRKRADVPAVASAPAALAPQAGQSVSD